MKEYAVVYLVVFRGRPGPRLPAPSVSTGLFFGGAAAVLGSRGFCAYMYHMKTK